MARWEPGTKDRLRLAALDLFERQGFEQTTTADIAKACGVTERTFFRHYADKREVLFYGQDDFAATFLEGLADARAGASALEAIRASLARAAGFFPEERRVYSRQRAHIIDANPGLQERELLKMAGLALHLAAAFRDRGIAEPGASLAAQTCTNVFHVAFEQWIAPGETRSFAEVQDEVLGELSALAREAATL